jgi:hypothetical protein
MKYCIECGKPEGEVKFQHKRRKCNKCKNKFDYKSALSKPQGKAKILLRNFKHCDKQRGLKTDLDLELVDTFISKPCSYCGETNGIGLDRIDNSLGHVYGNVVPCCYRCNFLRKDMPYEAWCFIAPTIKTVRELGLFGEWFSAGGETC